MVVLILFNINIQLLEILVENFVRALYNDNMGRKTENADFNCINCNANVKAIEKGTIRNHCPLCLFSLHLDIMPGDRLSDCHGVLTPVDATNNSKKGWQIVHKCSKCGHEGKNKLADDDNMDAVFEIMRKRSLHNRVR